MSIYWTRTEDANAPSNKMLVLAFPSPYSHSGLEYAIGSFASDGIDSPDGAPGWFDSDGYRLDIDPVYWCAVTLPRGWLALRAAAKPATPEKEGET